MSDPTAAAPDRASAPRPATARAALPRDLADFLIELSIALHKHAMYPGGHPTLEPAAAAVASHLAALLESRGRLSLGVARGQLIIEGVATELRNPVLHDLATRLHRHHLGAVSFTRGMVWQELEEALRLLAVDADRGGGPVGLRPVVPSWPHLRLYPLTFDRLQLLGDGDGDPGTTSSGRAAQLWVGLARAALAAEEVRPEQAAAQAAGELAAAPPEPAQVARAIDGHERGTAYDQVIVGYLLQIAEELKTSGSAGTVALRKKMSRLIAALEPQTLERLLDMGGDLAQRRQFLLDATQGMAVDAVVELVRAAAGGGAPISGAMVRMLTKLGHHVERGPAPRRQIAETGLREQVHELLSGWRLADPNPGGYGQALQRMVAAAPTFVTAAEARYEPEPLRIVHMAIETATMGEPVPHAVRQLLDSGRLADVLTALERAPAGNPAAAAIRRQAASAAVLREVLEARPVDLVLADRVAAQLGDEALPVTLDVLAASESRQLRRVLLDRLLARGPALAPLLAARLTDERWYVVRNILHLAAELPEPPAGLDAARFRQHADAGVRREALRVMLRQPDERSRAIAAALGDSDAKVRRLPFAVPGKLDWPAAAVPLLAALAGDEDADNGLRIAAVRALASQGGAAALEALLAMTVPRRRTLMGALAGTQVSPVTLAAIAALGSFLSDPPARERLALLAAGRDPAAARAAAVALKERT